MGIKKQLETLDPAASSLVSNMLKGIDNMFEDGTNPKLATSALVGEIAHWSLGQCGRLLQTDGGEESTLENSATSLVTLLGAFGGRLFHDSKFATVSLPLRLANHVIYPFVSYVRLAYRRNHDPEHVSPPLCFSFGAPSLSFWP